MKKSDRYTNELRIQLFELHSTKVCPKYKHSQCGAMPSKVGTKHFGHSATKLKTFKLAMLLSIFFACGTFITCLILQFSIKYKQNT